eukprot:gb/GEZN01025541.1/.p1 GENE.gb/GEZN01025541.1/~~gb/GEZN01025541.1/.p1  ORF type:complete len:163 (+),score=10.03 gb/GEZN01025541.1/:26-514(+)
MPTSKQGEYASVPLDESLTDDIETRKRARKELMDKTNRYIHALGWVGAAIFVVVYSNIWEILLQDSRVIRKVLYLGAFSGGTVFSIIIYLTISERCRTGMKLTDDLNKTHPRHIQVAAASSVLCWFCFVIACWPVWKFMTPVIMTVISMGLILSTNFLPNWC